MDNEKKQSSFATDDRTSKKENSILYSSDSDSEFQPSAPPLEPCDFAIPVSQVELTLYARLLLNTDGLTHSDPFCVLFLFDSTTAGEWIEVGRTETIFDDINPDWKTKFVLDYRFEEKQLLTFMIFDRDCTKASLDNHDFLGKLECTMADVVSAPMSLYSRFLQLPPIHEDVKSTLTIMSEELSDCKQYINFRLKCSTLTRWRGVRGLSLRAKKAFVNISKQLTNGTWVLLYRTDRVPIRNYEIDFPPISIRYTSICNKDNVETTLRFQLNQVKYSIRGKSTKKMGELITSFVELSQKFQNGEKLRFPLLLEKKGGTEDVGRIEIFNFSMEPRLTFVDYLRNGLEMNFAVAIDFTSSNGEPTNHASLHYKYGSRDNPYVATLKIIGNVLEDYCYSKQFHAYGFGAKGFPLANRVNHKFPLNFKEKNPACTGIEGIISAYSRALQRVKLYGPTCFAPLLRELIAVVEDSEAAQSNKYFVLLILTDGLICDPDTTTNELVYASNLPISVIIVGIGDADFSAMEKFDSDEKLLQTKSKERAARDIVQFFELRKYVNFKSINPISDGAKNALARAVLAELPQQVVSWMNMLELENERK